MKHILRTSILLLLAAGLTACLELKQTVFLRADGSGEIQLDYQLSPAALAGLRQVRTGPLEASIMPIPPVFPTSPAEVRALAQGNGIRLRSVTAAALPGGGRRLQYSIHFDSLADWNRSAAADLFRVELAPVADGVVELRCKGLGMDYLDWRLPRPDPNQTRRELALLKLAAKDLDYTLAIQTPTPVMQGNTEQLNQNLAVWHWRGADLTAANVIGPDQALVRPQIRFRTAGTKIQAPLFTTPFAAVLPAAADQVKLSLERFIVRRLADVPGKAREAQTVDRTQVFLAFTVRPQQGALPVAWSGPVYTELRTADGDNLVVPMPPHFRLQTLIPEAARHKGTGFQARSHFTSGRNLDQLQRVRGVLLYWTAENREQRRLPAVADWPKAGVELEIAAGAKLLFTQPAPGRISVAGTAETLPAIADVEFRQVAGRPLTPTARRFRARQLTNLDDPLNREIVYELPETDQIEVTVQFFTGLRQTRVPFVIQNLAAGAEELPPVTIDDVSGQALRLMQTVAEHRQGVRALALSPDGRWVASAGRGDKIVLRDWDTEQTRPLSGHPGGVHALAFAASGKMLWSGGQDRNVRSWHVADGREALVLDGAKGGIRALAIARDGSRLVVGTLEADLQMWRQHEGAWQAAGVLSGHRRGVRSAAAAADGRRLLTGGLDRQVILWDLDKRQTLQIMTGHRFPIRSVAIAADGSVGVSGGDDMAVKLWDLKTGKETREFKGHANLITGIAFLADGKRFAVSDMDGVIRIWHTAQADPLAEYKTDHDPVLNLAVSRTGRLAAGARSGKLLLFQLPAAP